MEFIKNLILPISSASGNHRCIQNGKIADMLSLLEGEEVIAILSDLHTVITPLFDFYANKKTNYLDF